MRLLRPSDSLLPDAPLGGKARALADLGAAGLPVPAWFVVPPEAALSPDEAAALVAAARELAPDGGLLAVRSSAAEEDGATQSFAGLFESFLGVAPGDVPLKVEAVRQSARGERVRSYRREQGLAGDPAVPSVLVQRLVPAETAGVAFSADPVSGRRGHALVSAVRGLGTALVGGATDADTFTIDRHGAIVARRVAVQTCAHRVDASAPGGVREEPIVGDTAGTPVLTDAQALAVAALARAAERLAGRPQDIEWAWAAGELWLLQARPVTALAGRVDPDGALTLWDNANIAESYNGVTTPLTFSFARGVYEAVYREFARLMGVPARRIAANADLFPRMLGLIEGRIYYNLINWYRLLALLPGFAFNRGFMEQMMGVKEGLPPEVLERLSPPGRWERWRDGLALAGTCAGLGRNHLTLPRQIRSFRRRLDLALRPPEPPLEAMRPDELAAHYRELERQLLLKWDAPLVNDFFAMIFHGVLRQLATKWAGDPDGTLQNDLLCAEGGMISAEPARRVRELARLAAADPAAVARLNDGTAAEIRAWLAEAPAFRARYEAYLEKFGDRCLEELKLESLTLHDEPLMLLRAIGRYARRLGAGQLAALDRDEAASRRSAEARVAAALAGRPLRRIVFGWVLRHARARVRDRENLRFERTRLFGRARRLMLEFGRRFHAAGRLAAPRDIFFLTVEEVLGFVEGTAASADLAGLAAVRQREFARYRARPPADRFATRGAVHLGNTFQADAPAVPPEGDALRGTGCCPGVVRGRVRRVTDPREAVVQPGEILVAARTDPGWIMLFPSAGGLLVEHGSLLSHSAIVARELGLPAIVAVRGVTAWLRTGDRVEMDGATGVVRRLPPEPAGETAS